MNLRKLTLAEVEFVTTFEPEETQVRGNALAVDDDAVNKKCEDEIIERLDRGDMFAWCCFVVKAKWGGFEGVDSLGCCSYENEEDARKAIEEHGMRQNALDDLNAELEHTAKVFEPLESDAVTEAERDKIRAFDALEAMLRRLPHRRVIELNHGTPRGFLASIVPSRVEGAILRGTREPELDRAIRMLLTIGVDLFNEVPR